AHEWRRGAYAISTDRARIDVAAVHRFLAGSYWAEGIPLEVVARSIENSLAYGIYDESGRQVGFARVITHRARFAYLADLFVDEAHRGRGLATWLMECVVRTPELRGLRRWLLVTRDAHALYEKFGFRPLEDPRRWMEIVRKNAYKDVPPEGAT